MLAGHLLALARRCNDALFRSSQPARRVAICAALTHDVGKATPAFQLAIRQQRRGDIAPAAACAALWCWWLSGRLALWERVTAVAAVLGHHGLLENTPVEELRRLASDARNGTMLDGQLKAMDVSGVGQFLLDSGSRFMLPVPAAVPRRQQLLDAMPEDRQLTGLGIGGRLRMEQFLEEHVSLLCLKTE